MKNKKPIKKKTGPKKEIKRPAHKKPRPKKHVEARIPELPPVPTKTVEITKVCAIHPDATKTPCLECMEEKVKTTPLQDILPELSKEGTARLVELIKPSMDSTIQMPKFKKQPWYWRLFIFFVGK